MLGLAVIPRKSSVRREQRLSADLQVMLSFGWEMWSASGSRLTCEQNHSNHVLTFSSADTFWVAVSPPPPLFFKSKVHLGHVG